MQSAGDDGSHARTQILPFGRFLELGRAVATTFLDLISATLAYC